MARIRSTSIIIIGLVCSSLSALLLVASSAIGASPPSILSSAHDPKAVDRVHVVVLGSSTAAGLGTEDRRNAWVNRYRRMVLEYHPNATVTNLARSGHTSYHINPTDFKPPADRPLPDAEYNITSALALSPTVIVINLPGNDVAAGFSVDERMANYDRVIALAAEVDVRVWVATPQPRNLDLEGRVELMEARDLTFARFGDKAIDFWTNLAESDGLIRPEFDSGDGVHLNDDAHLILARRVVDTIGMKAIVGTEHDAVPRVAGLRVFPNYPNPFSRTTGTAVEYEVVGAGPVAIWITDIHGRRITRLSRHHAGPGRHVVRWNGTDTWGSDVAKGVYLISFGTRTGTRSVRTLLVH